MSQKPGTASRVVPPARMLPRPATALIGRAAEVMDVCTRFQQGARLVTLTGPGGVGKTRVALAAAEQLHDRFYDGIGFVSLAPIADHRLVVPTIARTIGVMEQAGQPILDRLIDYLRERRMLLILDNVEHVVAAANSVSDLLRVCQHLSILATSREPLHLSGEREYAVPPLPLPGGDPQQLTSTLSDNDAVRLFVERATSVASTFVLTEANAPAVNAICYRVGGLPLAIELAAARVKVLTPEALLTRLDPTTAQGSLTLLAGGPRDAPGRQQTMRDTIQWSYDLLTDDERRAFRQLSVFAGGWALDAAEAVVAESGTFDLLASLVDKSLVQRVDEPGQMARYWMLEPIRQFGLECLAAIEDEEDAVRKRHAMYVLSLVDNLYVRLDGPDAVAWFERIENELDNIRTALRWAWESGDGDFGLRLAGNLGMFWDLRGYLNEGIVQINAFLSLPTGSRATVARAEALYMAGRMHGARGNPDVIVSLANEACAIFEDHEDRYGLARSLMLRGSGHLRRGDDASAQADWERAAPVLQEVGSDTYVVRVLVYLGTLARRRGQIERWYSLIEESLERALASNRPVPIAMALGQLGDVAEHRGNDELAFNLYRERLSRYHNLGVLWGIADTLELLARLGYRQGQLERAACLLSAAAVLRDQCGSPHRGDLTVQFDVGEVVRSVRDALPGETFETVWLRGQTMTLDEAIEYAVHNDPAPRSARDVERPALTRRELDVLRLLVDGKSNHEIASDLFISPNTVNTHVANIMNKLGLESRTAVATWAVRNGIV